MPIKQFMQFVQDFVAFGSTKMAICLYTIRLPLVFSAALLTIRSSIYSRLNYCIYIGLNYCIYSWLKYLYIVDWTNVYIVDWTNVYIVDWTNVYIVDWTNVYIVDWTISFKMKEMISNYYYNKMYFNTGISWTHQFWFKLAYPKAFPDDNALKPLCCLWEY